MADKKSCGRLLLGGLLLLGLILFAIGIYGQRDVGPRPVEGRRPKSLVPNEVAAEERVPADDSEATDEGQRASRADDVRSATEAARWRTWTSADGKYSVHAKFVKSAMGTMTLEKEDGSTVEVQLDRLCEEDQEFVRKGKWKIREPREVGPAAEVREIGPAAKITRVRLVPYTTPDGSRTQMLLVDWRNTGTTTIRAVDADITAYDAAGNKLRLFGDDGTINYTIYAVADSSPGIAPGEVYTEPVGEGFILPLIGVPEAARAEVTITEVVESGAY